MSLASAQSWRISSLQSFALAAPAVLSPSSRASEAQDQDSVETLLWLGETLPSTTGADTGACPSAVESGRSLRCGSEAMVNAIAAAATEGLEVLSNPVQPEDIWTRSGAKPKVLSFTPNPSVPWIAVVHAGKRVLGAAGSQHCLVLSNRYGILPAESPVHLADALTPSGLSCTQCGFLCCLPSTCRRRCFPSTCRRRRCCLPLLALSRRLVSPPRNSGVSNWGNPPPNDAGFCWRL